MIAVVVWVDLSEVFIGLLEHEAAVLHWVVGVVVGFVGMVRDYDGGRLVIGFEYFVHSIV
ncbi:MAG: hypothetical protein O7C59_03695 [Rickettsia endosymbiont of Ixodes persulcatus]|nr:hypothetical protein [Rickettsia endosymbiont of Ixodes persulcatus]